MKWPNGNQYKGKWLNNHKHGKGKYTNQVEGYIYEGTYDEDKR